MPTLFVRLSFLIQILYFPLVLEHKQIHPSDEERSITDGTALCFSYLHHFIQVPQGWLWSRLGFTASNFVIEVEFKVGDFNPTFLSGLLILFIFRSRATLHTYLVMGLLYG